jgi:hypothetical protein
MRQASDASAAAEDGGAQVASRRRIRSAPTTYRSAAMAFIALMLLAMLGVLSACSRSSTSLPAPTPPGSAASETLPETNASQVIHPEAGGRVALKDGAEVSIPRDGVADTSVANLNAVRSAPYVPIPRSLIGRPYEFRLDGDLSGVARVRLPLPSAVTPDQFDLAAFKWNGQAWERVLTRVNRNALEFGTAASSGIFSVQGQWRGADATLGLTMSADPPGQPTVPITVTGQYRYSSLPTMQNEYVPARLALKLDTSGGTGQITGDDSRDKTIGSATLWFKPDPTQLRATIDFSHVFEVVPSDLEVQPGSTNYVYAVLTVDDSPAPTRRLSTATEYTQILPIWVNGTEVVRPALPKEPPAGLRWHVRFNGQTMAQRPASELILPLSEFLSIAGLGEYRVRLESDLDGTPHPVSNEVRIVLAMPGTPTPTATRPPLPGTLAAGTAAPLIGTPTPGGPPPATPTRRTPPGGITPTSTATPAATSAPAPTPTATRPGWASVFWADQYLIAPGQCTTLHWNVQNVTAVYLNGEAATGNETRQVCPAQSTTYTLGVNSGSGNQDYRLTIAVQESGQPAVVFFAEESTIVKGQCTTLHWETNDVSAVFLDEGGVAGVATKEVCPETTTTYTLRVERTGSASVTKSVTIKVLPADQITMKLWAEQYSLQPGKCTTLHWQVEEVNAVYLTTPAGEQGVAGIGTIQACPTGASQVYTLRAEADNDRTATRRLTLRVHDPNSPGLEPNEVIAQGIVNSVSPIADADPIASGNQPGFQLVIDGVNPLFRGTGACCQTVVNLKLTQPQTSAQTEAMAERVDWPINPGQFVEFRGLCSGDTCSMPAAMANYYLKLRSN